MHIVDTTDAYQTYEKEDTAQKYAQCIDEIYKTYKTYQVHQSASYATGYSSAQNAQSSYAQGYSSYSYQNAYTNASNQPLQQHMVDSSLEGTLYGIMRVKKLMFNVVILPDKTPVSVPYEDIQYEFYVKTPVNMQKSLIYKIRPYVKERIMVEKKENTVGYCAVLVMESVDSESELPDEFTYTPNQTVPFKVSNARRSLNDDTFRFYIDDIDVGMLHDSQEDAYMNLNLLPVMYLFNEKKTEINKYEEEYEKHLRRIAKRLNKISYPAEPFSGVCIGCAKINARQYITVEYRSPTKSSKRYKNISFVDNSGEIGKYILVDDSAITYKYDNFNGLNVKLFYGESLREKDYYLILSIGGEVRAIDKIYGTQK